MAAKKGSSRNTDTRVKRDAPKANKPSKIQRDTGMGTGKVRVPASRPR